MPMLAVICVSENYLKPIPKVIMVKKPSHIIKYWNDLVM